MAVDAVPTTTMSSLDCTASALGLIDAIGEECRPRDPNQRPARRVPHQSKILFVGNSVAEPGDDRNVAVGLLDGGQRTDAHATEGGRYCSTCAEGRIQATGSLAPDSLGLRKVNTKQEANCQ